MVFFRQRFLLDMTRVASIISLSVLLRNAREKVKSVFATTWTQRITLPCPTSRVMQLSASVGMLLRLHSGLQTLIHHCPFHHYFPSCMAWGLCHSFSSHVTCPSQCQNLMEFYIWHAECHYGVLQGCQWYYCKQILKAAAVWTWWWGLGHNHRSSPCFEGNFYLVTFTHLTWTHSNIVSDV